MLCKSVLVTGSSRGLGFEMVKQLAECSLPPKHIFATCRSPNAAKALLELRDSHPENIKILNLDVKEEKQYENVKNAVSEIVGSDGLNLLINNAGIAPKSTRINMVTWAQMEETYLVNTIAPLMLTKTLLPVLKLASEKVAGSEMSVQRSAVINMSSILGSIQENELGGLYPYRASKCALNAITKSLSIDLKPHNILVSSIHPGWVQTELGGKNADITPQESVEKILKTLSSLSQRHNGGFIQYDGKTVLW